MGTVSSPAPRVSPQYWAGQFLPPRYHPRKKPVSGGHVGNGGAGLGFGEGKDYLPALLSTPHFLCFSLFFSPLEVRLRVYCCEACVVRHSVYSCGAASSLRLTV